MKADQKTLDEVTQTFKGMFEAYKKQDLKGVLSFWAPDPDIFVLGSGEHEKAIGVEQFSAQLKRDWEQAKVLGIAVKNFLVSTAVSVARFSADTNFHCEASDCRAFYLPLRLTGVMEKRSGRWLWVQMHLSVPNLNQEHGQSWPNKQ